MAAPFIKECMNSFSTSNLFLILGITKDKETISEAELKKAYKKLLLMFHPDKHSTKSNEEIAVATEKFKVLYKAYNILADPEKKELYLLNGQLQNEWFEGNVEETGNNEDSEESDVDYDDMPVLDPQIVIEEVEEENKEEHLNEAEEEKKQYEVEKIIGKRKHEGVLQYHIKWKGYSSKDNTWEDTGRCDCPDAIKEFEAKKQRTNGKNKTKIGRNTGSSKKSAKADRKRDRKRKATQHPQSQKKSSSSK